MSKHRRYWTLERCIESALKYKTPGEWLLKDSAARVASGKHGWYKKCTAHMSYTPKGYWNKERCMESAAKHDNPKNWYKNESGAVVAAYRNGWFKECTAHMARSQAILDMSGSGENIKYVEQEPLVLSMKEYYYTMIIDIETLTLRFPNIFN